MRTILSFFTLAMIIGSGQTLPRIDMRSLYSAITTLQGDGTDTFPVPIDDPRLATISVAVSDPSAVPHLTGPAGEVPGELEKTGADELTDALIPVRYNSGSHWTFSTQGTVGLFQLTVSGQVGAAVSISASYTSDVSAGSVMLKDVFRSNETVAAAFRVDGAVPSEQFALIRDNTGKVTRQELTPVGDGHYALAIRLTDGFTFNPVGSYTIGAQFRGTSSYGVPFYRTATTTFRVIEENAPRIDSIIDGLVDANNDRLPDTLGFYVKMAGNQSLPGAIVRVVLGYNGGTDEVAAEAPIERQNSYGVYIAMDFNTVAQLLADVPLPAGKFQFDIKRVELVLDGLLVDERWDFGKTRTTFPLN